MNDPGQDVREPAGGIEAAVRREQARINLATARITLRSSVLVAGSAATIVWIETGGTAILAWLAVSLSLTFARIWQIGRFERDGLCETDPGLTLRRSWQNSLVQGVLWGALPFLVLHGPPSGELAFLAFIIAGTTAGSVIQSRAYANASVAFVVPSLAGLVLWCLWIGTYGSVILAVNVALLAVLMAQNLRIAERNFINTHRLRFEATALAASLDAAVAREVDARERLAVVADTDAVTGLRNRAAFNRALAAACDEAARTGRRFALLLVDLDRFKSINDTLGHVAGDAVLVEAARSVAAAVGTAGKVARIGGDEFAVLVTDGPDDAAIDRTGEALVAALSRPIRVAGRPTVVGGSVGAAVYPSDAGTDVDLLAYADIALYAAKDAGRRRYRRFDAGLRQQVDTRRQVELELAEAIEAGEVQVVYQPQVSLPGGEVIGVEALLRWKHRELGWVSPPDMVEAASTAFLSDRLTGHVLEAACRLVRRLDAIGRSDLPVAVNLSPREFRLYSPADLVVAVCARHGVPTSRFEVEITEEAMFDTAEGRVEVERLASAGVRIAVDDFGAGHSSLAYLASLHVDRIKIDRRFVGRIGYFERDREVVEAILGVGRVLDVKVMAEGVETAEQARILSELGCQEAQGYLFGRPEAEEVLLRRLAAAPEPHPRALPADDRRF